jgi:hypothetical protein
VVPVVLANACPMMALRGALDEEIEQRGDTPKQEGPTASSSSSSPPEQKPQEETHAKEIPPSYVNSTSADVLPWPHGYTAGG